MGLDLDAQGETYGMSISKVKSVFELAKGSHVDELLVLVSEPGVSGNGECSSMDGGVEGKSHLVSEGESMCSAKDTPADRVFRNEGLKKN